MKHEDDMNCGNTNLNTDMIVAVVIANSPEKKNWGLQRDSNPWPLRVSPTVRYSALPFEL